jgi:serine/threonine protein kinase/WD40 repeat protein
VIFSAFPHYWVETVMPDLAANIEAIFLEALEQPEPARAAFLDRACGGDALVLRRVRELLQGHEQSRGPFDAPPAGLAGTADLHTGQEGPGAFIGPYKLMEQIGEGGMGLVFVAEQQQPVRRKVALKVIKPGMDTREVIARFEAERQALALMDHPNIARVIDAGTTDSGRPYFVMELVRGVEITQFCDENRFSPRERLELFVDVCQAVQHAHQKGVIHRDLKATNILVTLHDGTPVVKVIDFGVAKAIGQHLTDKTIYTRFAQMIGTPMYMSPEQAEMSGLDIDTRSDIYALGVLLYELLTGATPFDKERLQTAAFDEIRRIIREEEPPRPSTRFSTLGQATVTLSANRKSDPRRLTQLFRGELDWIVMKALEKDRNRRYETASAFAADVQRYLNDEAVQACPPSAGYRLRKFFRRYKGRVLVAAGALVLLLVIGVGIPVYAILRQERDVALTSQQRAERAEEKARGALDELQTAQQEIKIRSHLSQARAFRQSGQIGQRFKTLDELTKALRLDPSPKLRMELRNEAIAALTLPDLETAQEWDGFPDGTLSLAFDADFQTFARLSRTGSVTVCRLSENGEEVIAQLPARGKPPYFRLWMSPDGRVVALGHSRLGQDDARGVCVWKLDGSEPFEVPEGVHISALAFRPDGRQLAVGHVGKSVSVYDLATGQCVKRLANTLSAAHLAFHPSDSRLAVASNAGVRLFDVDNGSELPVLRHPPGVLWAYSVAWHPDGRRLAAGCNDRKIHLWDTETGTEVMPPWVGDAADGSIVAFNRDGDRLGSRDWTGLARVWDTATGRLLLTAPGFSWHFSPTDGLHGYGIEGTKVKLWRLAAGRELRVLRRPNADSLERIHTPVVHADGRMVAAGSFYDYHPDRSWLCFFDLWTGEELASVKLPHDWPVCFRESVGWITSGPSGLLQWPAQSDPARPEVLRVGPPRTLSPGLGSYPAQGAGASADGGVLAVPDGNFTALIHRGRPAEPLKLGPQHDVRFAAVSPKGRWVATCSWFTDGRSKSTRIWEADSGRPVRELPLEGATRAMFSPDGRWLATYNWSGTQLWEVGTWQPGRRFEGAPLFSPDSRLVALGGFGAVRLLETDTGREVARLTSPEATLYGAACFTPDGTRLIAQGLETLHVWDLRAIRQQLNGMGLDWEWPEFGPEELIAQAAKPVKVEVLTGDLRLTREQKARQAIERYGQEVKANPNSAEACDGLAWAYLTAPVELRDVKAALPLAEKAVHLAPGDLNYRNTLGVAYYRNERYREAVELLRANLEKQADWVLATDLYFLAMSQQRLGEAARARDYFDWAVRWTAVRPRAGDEAEVLTAIRAEAEELLGIDKK